MVGAGRAARLIEIAARRARFTDIDAMTDVFKHPIFQIGA
jgi:hypothetical protein